jgi:hypothetical protein
LLGNAGTEIIFRSEEEFQITYPTRCNIDKNESTSVKLYIYLTDRTPVDAVTVSTDDTFNKYTTLKTVAEKYGDTISSVYKQLTVFSKERTTLGVSRHFTLFTEESARSSIGITGFKRRR